VNFKRSKRRGSVALQAELHFLNAVYTVKRRSISRGCRPGDSRIVGDQEDLKPAVEDGRGFVFGRLFRVRPVDMRQPDRTVRTTRTAGGVRR